MSSLNRQRILVVDDEPDLLDVLELELVYRGAVVLRAGSAQEALAILAAGPVALILSDVRMARGGGADLARAVAGRTPVLFMSGYADMSPRAVHALGVEGVLGKPFQLREITERCRRALRPRAERWADAPATLSMMPAPALQPLALGRGGFKALLPFDAGVPTGAALAFSFTFAGVALAGAGTVRWLEPAAAGATAGIEIDWLDDATRCAALAALGALAGAAYIPG